VTVIPPFEAVVFDCDGVLADTDEAWALAERALCERNGVRWTHEIGNLMHGMSGRAAVGILAKLMERPPPLDVLEQQLLDAAAPLLLDGVHPLPGAVALVDELAARVPVAVASNTPRRLLERILRAIGVTPALSAIVAADEVPLPKPAPDVYREAVRRLGVDPAATLVFEDSPTGAAAAIGAGCQVVGVAASGRPPLDGVLLTVTDLDRGLPASLVPRAGAATRARRDRA
jgi:HAD superfamily hydrolase (TIGR01509 family)